ncbi:thiol-disulfide oxidoreductase DCC family protein [Paenibacillus gansuensis]|uniref:Thiol-disulfide oxidoreductase DCC family protein n=1 Tax=Paenibacillus gansuensis TaxID=306542 RepID=A0ABW5P758_9BACL
MKEHDLLLIDGECMLCAHVTRFVIARDREDRFRFAALQSQTGQRLLKEHGEEPGRMDSFVLVRGDRMYMRSAAALRVLQGLGGAWRLAVFFLVVPRFVRDAVYNMVARNRYRWFGTQDVCLWRTPEIQRKFIDEWKGEDGVYEG